MPDYNPMTATEHRQRWAAATAVTWEFLDGLLVPAVRDAPGLHPEHVFDFRDGLRLIVSVDKYSHGTHLHVSASVFPRSKLYDRKLKMPEFQAIVKDRVGHLSGLDVEFGYATSKKRVLHFYHPPLPSELVPEE